MNDDAFARLIAEEVKNRVSTSQRDYLRLPENWDRWQRALVALDRNLDNQLDRLLSDENADRDRYGALGQDGVKLLSEALSDYNGRRTKIERFKFHVGKRLDEVTRMIAIGSDGSDSELTAYSFLRKAVERHRQMLEEFDLESTPIDQALWDALEGRWSFDLINQDDILSGDEN